MKAVFTKLYLYLIVYPIAAALFIFVTISTIETIAGGLIGFFFWPFALALDILR